MAGNIAIDGAHIFWRNFNGNESKFNPPGKRSFCVQLDEELALQLQADGWNVKFREPRDEDSVRTYFLQVGVAFNAYPPQVWLVNSKGKTKIDEASAGMLDWCELENVDLIIRPYSYEINGKKGIKAYLKAGYFTIVENEFDDKYSDLPVQ